MNTQTFTRTAILTYYLPATNTLASRIKAIAGGKVQGRNASGDFRPLQVTLQWDHGLSIADNHNAAAMALASSLGWSGRWIAGGNYDGSQVYVKADPREAAFVVE